MIKIPKLKNPFKKNGVKIGGTSILNQSQNKLNTISPKVRTLTAKLEALWIIIKLKITKRIIISVLIILLVAYVSMYVTLGYQILVNGRQDKFAKSAIKVFPIPVAYVGNNFIFAGDYFTRVTLLEKYRESSQQPAPEDPVAYRNDIMDKVIFSETLRQLSYKNKIRLTPKEIDAEYNTIISTLPDTSKASEEIMKMYGLTVPQFKRFVSEVAIENKLLSEKLVSYHFAHIMITDQGTAQTVLDKAKAGTDFAELAKNYSEDKSTRDTGGDIGFVDRDTANQALGKDFEETAFGISEVNQVADKVAQSPYGFHIVKLLEKKGEINTGLIDWVNDYKSKIKVVNYFTSATNTKNKVVDWFK